MYSCYTELKLGLYDCSGNVWEWSYDTTGDLEEEKNYIYDTLDDDSYDAFRILKGGSWGGYAADCDLLCSKFNLAVRANS